MVTMKTDGRKPSLCILNYNGEQVIVSTLDTATRIAECFAEIVVVDNGSTDSSVALIRDLYPQVRLIETGANLGASAGRNAGLAGIDNPLLLLMDNDVTLNKQAVLALLTALADGPDAVLAVPMVCYADRPSHVQYGGSRCHYLGQQILDREEMPLDEVGAVIEDMNSLVSCCFLIDRSRIEHEVTFDEAFFIYFEDHELGLRLRIMGYRLIAVPNAHVLHGAGTKGLSIRQLGDYSPRRVFHLIRNRWLLLLKLYSVKTLLLLAPMLAVYEFAQLVIAIKKGWLSQWTRALTSIARDAPQVLSRRRAIQRQRKVADRELLVASQLPFRQELTSGRLERVGLRLLDLLTRSYWTAVSRLL